MSLNGNIQKRRIISHGKSVSCRRINSKCKGLGVGRNSVCGKKVEAVVTGMSKRKRRNQMGSRRSHQAALTGSGRVLNLISRATGSPGTV